MNKGRVRLAVLLALVAALSFVAVGARKVAMKLAKDAAQKVYVPPGEYDEFYAFLSGGFNGQLSVVGLPSGRTLKNIGVFSVNPRNGYGFSPETKPLLMTSHGFLPWDDTHHPELSMTNGVPDGRWIFINANNTPRIARIDLEYMETAEIIEIPNSAGNHPSSFVTENTEYITAGTRFSVPLPQKDIPIDQYKGNFKGTLSFIKVDPDTGKMSLAFQILVPGFDYDLAHCGKGPSHDWCFFTSYNTEEAHTLLEINASQHDKDFIAAVNWKRAEECIKEGKYETWNTPYAHNWYDEKKHMAFSEIIKEEKVIKPEQCPGVIYFIPTPKSPHGVDVSPDGRFILGNGKLSATMAVHSFEKMLKAIKEKKFAGDAYGIPILDYDAVVDHHVKNVCLGPLHTESDGKGYAYTSCFISSEIVKWKWETGEIVDRIPVYYSVGHLMIPGGDSAKPWGKYVLAMNKITKDRYLPTGPELNHAAQLIDITGDKMQLLLDFPTLGEPHYAQALPASLIKDKQAKIYNLKENEHPYATKSEKEVKVVRKGNEVHVYMTAIRSHFVPDNIEGVKVGDTVYFHVTNLEQDWDIPHGFAVYGADMPNLLIMPGQTLTLVWKPEKPGVYPFYCTDFCSALHQEMQGYVRVSPADANPPMIWRGGGKEGKWIVE